MKELFGDAAFKRQYGLSAVNSINWARILVQTVYYLAAYGQLLRQRPRADAGPVRMRVAVPTGNFGDVMAGYYARAMGLPIASLAIATNRNDILPRFFATGRYTRQPAVHQTPSPAMDIQISSNFERYLYYLADERADVVAAWMRAFQTTGELAVTPEQLRAAQGTFVATAVSDDEVSGRKGPGSAQGAPHVGRRIGIRLTATLRRLRRPPSSRPRAGGGRARRWTPCAATTTIPRGPTSFVPTRPSVSWRRSACMVRRTPRRRAL